MFNKILVPLDGSELAAKILPQVVDLAKTHNSQVILLHVCFSELGEAPPETMQTAMAREEKRCEIFLAQAAKDLRAQGIGKVRFECVEGYPDQVILGYARKHGMDLIALASHGKGKLAWVLRSVAEEVLSHATVPVLLFRVLEIKLPELKLDYFPPIP